MMVLGHYWYANSDVSKSTQKWSTMPPASVEATPDSWARANHFRVG